MTSPEISKSLLAKLGSKEMSLPQLAEICARWTLSPGCWESITIKSFPTPPPEWQEYEQSSKEERAKIKPEFFQQDSVRAYLSGRNMVLASNFSHYSWLRECKKSIQDTAENFPLHKKLDEKIIAFARWLNIWYPRQKVSNLETQEQREPMNPEENLVMSIFGGVIV